jgi:hypothetical protein
MIALVERLAARFPALGSPAGWHAEFSRELNATDDRKHFSAEGIPVIEGKHVEPFVVRTADVATRIPRAALERVLPDRRFDRPRLAYRDVSGVGNRQSLLAAIIPPGIVTTHTIFCLRNPLPPDQQYLLCGLFNSFVVNALVRLLMGGHVTTSLVEGLPVPSRTGGALEMRIAALAREIGAGGAPAASMAALQSAVAQLYEIRPAEFRNVLAGFPLVAIEEREAAARCLEAPGTGESLALRTS